jgi:WD40 repeat protein
MARIFISHSSRNNAAALALRDWLVSQGWNDLFLDIHPTDGLVAAERWQAALRASIGRCRAVIFCLSPEWRESEHCISEFNEAMHVGATPVGVIVKQLPFDRIPGEMTTAWQLVDLTRGGETVSFTVAPPPQRLPINVEFPAEELVRLRAGLAKLGLVGFETDSFLWPPKNEPDRAPYRGLEPLDVVDAGIFFGRDSDLVRAREELLELRLRGGGQLFIILGASGAGKSSFLRAGLLPRLQRDDRDFLLLPFIRPESSPLSGRLGLASSLTAAFDNLRRPLPLGEIRRALEQDPTSLAPLLGDLRLASAARLTGEGSRQVDRPSTLVLAIDQAEELFGERSIEAERFLNHLSVAVAQGPEMIALLTIRSDRFEILQAAEKLRDLPKHLFDLPPVTPFAYREAIQRPASRVTPPIEIDTRLVERLIDDTATEGADPLPLLALTLQRLYLDYGRATRRLTNQHYESLGGLAGSLEAALAHVFARPDQTPIITANAGEQERLLETTFIPALVDINPINNEPVRRIAKEAEIPAEGHALVARLVENRLLVRNIRGTESQASESTIEVAHEALLRQWPTLRRLLDRRVDDLRSIQALERAAMAWEQNGRRPEWLDHRGARLVTAQQILANLSFQTRLSGLPQEFIEACAAKEVDDNRRLRRVTGIAFVGPSREAFHAGNFELALRYVVAGAILAEDPEFEVVPELFACAQRAVFYLPTRAVLAGHRGWLTNVNLSQDGKRIVTSSEDGTARIWDIGSGVELVRIAGHSNAVASAVFNREGTLLLTSSADGTARIWDVASGRQLAIFEGHEDDVTCAAFIPGDNHIVTASEDATARIWRVDQNEPPVVLQGHEGSVLGLTVRPDGKQILTVSHDRTARLWDLSGTQALLLKGHEGDVLNAVFSSDAKRILTASRDGSVRIWNARSGRQIAVLGEQKKDAIKFAFSPNDRYVVMASSDGTARLWDTHTQRELAVLRGHLGAITSVSFSSDSLQILSTSADRSARLWDTSSGGEKAVFWGHTDQILYGTLTPDGKRVVTISSDKEARIWAVSSSEPIAVLRGHKRSVVSADISPDGNLVATASSDSTARVWNRLTGGEIMVLRGHGDDDAVSRWLDDTVRTVAFSSDGKRILTASGDTTARLWDVRSGHQVFVLAGHAEMILCAAFSPNDVLIVTGSEDRTARLWDAATGQQRAVFEAHQGGIKSVAFSPDNTKIVTTSEDGTAQVWDAASGQPLGTFREHRGGITSGIFSPDSARILTASRDNSGRVWEAVTQREITVLEGHVGEIVKASFRQDGVRILTASADGTARIWDADSGKEIVVLSGHTASLTSATFSPNNALVATSSADSTAKVWDAELGSEIVTLAGHEAAITGVIFFPNGTNVLTVSQDSTARIWDVARVTVAIARPKIAMVLAALGPQLAVIREQERDDLVLKEAPANLYASAVQLWPQLGPSVKEIQTLAKTS